MKGNAEMEKSDQPSGEEITEEDVQISFFQMVFSVLAAFFGVQSHKNRVRDFKHGKVWQFIIVGIFMTFVWYFAIYLVVQLVLP